jgi:hypothetical protein
MTGSRLTVIVGLLLAALSGHAENKALRQRVQDIWQNAEEVSTPDAKTASYHEEAVFTLHGVAAGDLQGTYRKEFADPKNWLEEVKLGTYQQFSIQKGDNLYKYENADFTPLGVEQFIHAVAPPKLMTSRDESVRKIDQAISNGVNVTCVESDIRLKSLAGLGAPTQTRVTCVSAADGTLLSESEFGKTWVRTGYVNFSGKMLPTRLEASVGGQKSMEAQIVYREHPSLKAASIQVPTGMQPEPQCKTRVPPEIISRPQLPTPEGPNFHDPRRKVVVGILVGVDGRVKKSKVVQTAGQPLDRDAEDSVLRWVFKPSLCDGTPIETKIKVEVSFHNY